MCQNMCMGFYKPSRVFNPISHGVKEDPPSHGGGAIITKGLNKYFPTDFWQFLYIYQLCYISGHPMQKELSLASKL